MKILHCPTGKKMGIRDIMKAAKDGGRDIGEMGGHIGVDGFVDECWGVEDEEGRLMVDMEHAMIASGGKKNQNRATWHMHPYRAAWWPSGENITTTVGKFKYPGLLFTKYGAWLYYAADNFKRNDRSTASIRGAIDELQKTIMTNGIVYLKNQSDQRKADEAIRTVTSKLRKAGIVAQFLWDYNDKPANLDRRIVNFLRSVPTLEKYKNPDNYKNNNKPMNAHTKALRDVDEFVLRTNPENEVEMRFKDPVVQNGVDYETYERIIQYFSGAPGWKRRGSGGGVTSLVVFYKHRRKNFQFRTIDGKTEFKKKIFHREMKDKLDKLETEYGVRCAESKEEVIHIRNIHEFEETFRRLRTRTSFVNGDLRLDCTKVLQRGSVNYEIELECVGLQRGSVVDTVARVVELIQGGDALMKYSDLHVVSNAFYSLLKQGKKFPAPLPKTLRRGDMDAVSCGYSVTEKADGTRYLMYIDDKKDEYLLGRPKGRFSKFVRVKSNSALKDVVMDGEMVGDVFYAFDILYYKNDLRSRNLEERLTLLGHVVTQLRDPKIKMKTFYLSHRGGSIKMKMRNGISGKLRTSKNIYDTAIKLLSKKDRPYDLDGVIFTPMHRPYDNDAIFKWKDNITIDFFYSDGHLHIAGNNSNGQYENMRFSSRFKAQNKAIVNAIYADEGVGNAVRNGVVSREQFKKYEGSVVECEFKNGGFVPIKKRGDKIMANNLVVVNDAWESIRNPLTLTDIRDNKYNCARKYHNAIKRRLIQKFMTGKEVLDIGSGAGGDIGKYVEAKVKRVVGVDVVPVKYEHPNHMKFIKMNSENYDIQNELEERSIPGKFDVVNCQFAAHYFFKNETKLQEFCTNVFASLKKGGLCVMTVMSGEKVHRIFEATGTENGDSFEIPKVFSVKRKYDTFGLTGNGMSVMLHGTKYFDKPSEEYGVNVSMFVPYFEKFNMKLVMKKSFKEFEKLKEATLLNDGERSFSFFNTALVFQKN